jgi:DNA-binding NarL/FixJ family response regulator
MARTTADLAVTSPEVGRLRRSPRLRQASTVVEETSLTPRELQILGLLGEGHSTKDVARRLSISSITVRNHIQRLLPKLSAHTRLEALAAAYRRGLLEPPFPKVP